jgi:3-deoxy-D-manno-octulosonate 8-phosphate phosphatase (KDO 8-P phosphatase)
MINRKNLSQIKCIVAEVDGVLTDGQTWLNHLGHKQRKFSVRDSMSIRRLIKSGYGFAVVYNSQSPADEKEITEHFGQVGVKYFIKNFDGNPSFSNMLSGFEITEEECVFLHASLFELKNKFGFEVTVANAPQEVRTSVEHVTGSEGGEGALAEFSQLVLDHGSYSSSQTTARKAVNL